ncbi:NAD binding Rossmann fold oxidoreductase-like protein, partial [Periconia macrospinosa]
MAPSAITPPSNDISSFLEPIPKSNFVNPPRILIIGGGSRGTAYAKGTHESTNAIIAAIAEPIAYKRAEFGRKFIWGEGGKSEEGQAFAGWKEWVEYETSRRAREQAGEPVPKGVDAVFVCVLDEQHEEVLCSIAHLNVHICCEKPLSTSLQNCVNIYKALSPSTEEKIFGICHVLRYSPFNMLLKQLVVENEVIGDVLSIEHVEPVGWWHYSHSYVRGNWRKESTTAPSLLTKSCHDIDFLLWLFCTPPPQTPNAAPHLPSTITSTGSRTFFRKARKPKAAGTATNCLSCAHEPSCLYSAKKIYKERHLDAGNTGWPVKIVNPEIEEIYQTLGKEAASKQLLQDLAHDYTNDTPVNEVSSRSWYGRCVWDADNDVCDDQYVTLTWDDESPTSTSTTLPRTAKTAQFHMVAFTEKICERRGTIYGTRGEIAYDSDTIKVHDFATGQTKVHTPHVESSEGHGGGDTGLARQFLKAVNAVMEKGVAVRDAQRGFLGCDLEEAVRSHAVVFAAEEARRE